MASGPNGNRRPPRPRIEIAGAASDAEAAAIAVAIEQFLADTAPRPATSRRPAASAWQRAALVEGVSARRLAGVAWGHAPIG